VKKEKQNSERLITGILLFGIIFFAGFIRFYGLGVQSFWLDEGVSVVHARAILKHGYPLLPNGIISWDAFPVHYLLSVGLKLFSDQHIGARFFSVLAGVLLLPAYYFLNMRLFNKSWQSLLATLLLAVMTWEAAWSRQARVYPFLLLFMVLGTALLLDFLQKKRVRSLWGAGFCLVLSIFSHRAGYLLALIFLLILILNSRDLRSSLLSIRRTQWFLFFFFIGGMMVYALFFVHVHSSFSYTLKGLLRGDRLNYSHGYAAFLYQQMGGSLFLALGGMLVSLRKCWRVTLPLIIALLSYYYVISLRTWLFAFRYTLPLLVFLPLFAAYLIGMPLQWRHNHDRKKGIVAVVVSLILMGVAFYGLAYTIVPQKTYLLSETEPQPRWKEAYELIQARERKFGYETDRTMAVTTISAFPFFHDIYIGEDTGRKYYLPVSFTGYPGEVHWCASYTSAEVVLSLDDLLRIKGYLILDDFAFRMLVNDEIRNYLLNHEPNAILPGRVSVFIWLMGANR